MPKITHIIRADIELSQQPVQELCDVIAAVLPAYRGMEKEILIKLREAIDDILNKIEGGEMRNGNDPAPGRNK
jgi:hypothetical protein